MPEHLEQWLHRLARFVMVILAAGALTALTIAALTPPVVGILSAHTADPVQIDLDPLAQRSIVLAADGTSVLAALQREENRKVVSLDEMPPVLIETVLAVEDQGFYDHGGVDARGVLRALFKNVESGELKQGGSTITQQLVKNALLDPKQDFDRKIKEAVLAVRLEQQMSKEEILERYLNTVYLGTGTYGVQAAAETYFAKDAIDLDQAESALLAGMIKNPTGYDPYRHPEATTRRMGEVVRRLEDVGVVDEAGAAEILARPLPTEVHSLLPKPEDHYVNEVVRRLLADERLGATEAERYNAVFRGGLTITTTLDVAAQQQALAAVESTMPDTGGKFTAALVSVEPGTGAVRSLVGGEGFELSKYNIATQGIGRQVGSSMKPFVLAAAIDEGISPKSTINGSGPCKIPNPGGAVDPYEAENFEGGRAGTSSLYEATRSSVNCAYLRLGQLVGIDDVIAMTNRLGVTAKLPDVPSLPLGTAEIRPIEMAAAYATFAADGVYHEPFFVSEVRDRNGEVIFRQDQEGKRVITAEVARQVTDVLENVVSRGTATAARFRDRRPAAGKTGTTADYGDAWFVGYTPELSTAVWMGSPIGRVPMRGVGGVGRVTGGSFPSRIWQAYMGPTLAGRPIQAFPEPEEVGPAKSLKAPTATTSSVPGTRRSRPRSTTTSTAPDRDGTTTTTAPDASDPLPSTTSAPPATTAPPASDPPPSPDPVATGQTDGGA